MGATNIRLIFAVSILVPVAILQGQSAPSPTPEMPDTRHVHQFLRQGKYLQALAELEKLDTAHPIIRQELATVLSFVGDCQGALAAMGIPGIKSPVDYGDAVKSIRSATRLDALDAIVAAAHDRQIVIINEAHHVPLHRAFSLQLAGRLREMGFDYLAAETFAPLAENLAKQGFPTQTTGFYSKEPVYGEFIRRCLQMGFRPVAYEMLSIPGSGMDQTDRINYRESEQCQNLVRQIFSKDPGAKVLIHVGYSHATEDTQTLPDGREQAWMAARLKKATSLDPLTIDQTVQTEKNPAAESSGLWKLAQTEGWLEKPAVFQNADQSFLVGGHYAGKVDIQVFHPATEMDRGRPDWLLSLPGRQSVEIPSEMTSFSTRVLVQAFWANEPAEAIPVDQFLLDPKLPTPVLALPVGEFRLIVQDESGESVIERQVTVTPLGKDEPRMSTFPN